MPGHIIMGHGARVRRGYRVLGAVASRTGVAALGITAWKVSVEPLSKAAAQAEVEAGCPRWGLTWDPRRKGPQHV